MTPTEKSRKLFDFHKDVTDRYMEYSESREVYYDVLVDKLKQNSEAKQLLQEAITESRSPSEESNIILQMLLGDDETLSGHAYEDIATSDYDSIVSLIPQLITAYYETDIYDYANDNPDTIVGTLDDKTEALALYFETIVKRIRNKKFEPQMKEE